MNYLLMIEVDAAAFEPRTPAEAAARMAPWTAYTEALREAGALVGAERLHGPASATTLRVRDGKRQVQDGPYADTKEQLGGYYLIDVPDLDSALDWAARCPGAAYGTIQVRPTWTP